MSITHITNKMLVDKEPFIGSKTSEDLQALLATGILVAHNAKFDITMLGAEGIKVPRFICTFASREVWILKMSYRNTICST